MASKNAADYPYMDTVLFFDEANTTEAATPSAKKKGLYKRSGLS
jgi:hypothetical protein